MTDRLENDGVIAHIKKHGFIPILCFEKDGKEVCQYSRVDLLKVFTATRNSELPNGMKYDKDDMSIIYIKDSITMFKDYLYYLTEYMQIIGEQYGNGSETI